MCTSNVVSRHVMRTISLLKTLGFLMKLFFLLEYVLCKIVWHLGL